MTHTDYTKEILNIKDKNIYFNENCLETKKDGNVEIKIFHGYLTYTPEFVLIVALSIMVQMILLNGLMIKIA